MGLDRPLGDVELLGDLAVGEPVGGEDGDAVLRRRERLDAGERGAARPGAGALQLVAGAAGEQAHAAAVGDLERPAQRLAGVVAAVGPPERGAEVDERARVLEPVGRGLEQGAGLLQQRDAVAAAGERAQGGALRAGEPEALGEREVLLRELARAVLRRLGEVDAPRREARVRDAQLAPAGAGREQVGPGLRVAALREPQPAARLEEERSGERARRRVAEQVGPGQRPRRRRRARRARSGRPPGT